MGRVLIDAGHRTIRGQAQRTARKDAAEDAEVAIISDIGTQLPGSWSLREALSNHTPVGCGNCLTISTRMKAVVSQMPKTVGVAPNADTVPYIENAPSPTGSSVKTPATTQVPKSRNQQASIRGTHA